MAARAVRRSRRVDSKQPKIKAAPAASGVQAHAKPIGRTPGHCVGEGDETPASYAMPNRPGGLGQLASESPKRTLDAGVNIMGMVFDED